MSEFERGGDEVRKSQSPRVCIIIPAWNEEDSLPSVLAEVAARVPEAVVVVVSDGSHDSTAKVARQAGTHVLDLPLNLGVGGAMRAGYQFAVREDFDIAVQLDADGQHRPGDVARLVEVIHRGKADIVIGARFAGEGDYEATGPRWWAMKFLSRLLSRVVHTRLTDSTSGFKACSREATRVFARDYPAEYLGDTVEALVIAAKAGLVVRQVPVVMRERLAGRPSHNPLKSAIFLGRALLALLVASSRSASSSRQAVK